MLKLTVPDSWHRRGRPGPRGKAATEPPPVSSASDPLPARRRARRVPELTVSESQIQVAVIAHLRAYAWPDVVFWHVPNGGARSKAEAARFKAQGVVAGIQDIHILHNRRLLVLELKTERGRLSPEQRTMLDRMSAAGAVTAVAYGLDQALAILKAWGVLRRAGGDR